MSPAELTHPGPRSSDPSDHKALRFRLVACSTDDGVRELKVDGELDLAVVDRFKEAIDAAGGGPVLVDLSGCTFLDSTGLAVVLLARREGARVVLHSPSVPVRRILSLVGLTGEGVVFEDRDEAIRALRGQEREG